MTTSHTVHGINEENSECYPMYALPTVVHIWLVLFNLVNFHHSWFHFSPLELSFAMVVTIWGFLFSTWRSYLAYQEKKNCLDLGSRRRKTKFQRRICVSLKIGWSTYFILRLHSHNNPNNTVYSMPKNNKWKARPVAQIFVGLLESNFVNGVNIHSNE